MNMFSIYFQNCVMSVQINLPDGRVQIVNYVSDKDGFRADVTYEGTPVFHEAPPGGYGPYKGPGVYPGPKPGGYNTAPDHPGLGHPGQGPGRLQGPEQARQLCHQRSG